MRDDLLHYYERELTYLRRLGAEFGKRYPRVASGLQLESTTRSEDPHVERLLEGFAFLAARVHLKIDDQFPEVAQALLNSVYPEYDRPIPSMSLVQFHVDPTQAQLSTGYVIPAGKTLYSRPVAGVPCSFRTCYDTTLWPIQIEDAAWVAPHQLKPPVRGTEAFSALRVLIRSTVPFAKLPIEQLRLYINAEPNVAAALYELVCNNCDAILLRNPAAPEQTVTLPPSALRPVGFEPDEGVLPLPRRSHVGYRLLMEYFAFPEKYLFLDLTGLDRLRAAHFGDAVEIVFLISRFERAERRALLEGAVTGDVIRLGCSPIINLFSHASEPILLTHRRPEYQIVPDARRREAIAVHSVDRVTVTTDRAEPIRFEPLYSYRHGSTVDKKHFWHATRRPRQWRPDEGSDVFLSFVDVAGTAAHPDVDTVTAHLLCYNADLPSRLQIGDVNGDFQMEGATPIRIAALVNPTPSEHARTDGSLLWRLVSLLSLNLVSILDGGPDTLQEILRLHSVRESASADKQIQALVGLRAAPGYARISSEHGLAFARGQYVDIEFDEEQFAGGGVYLLASVIERFLGLYTSLNSFSVLRARTRQRREVLKEWPPRAGWKALI